MQIAFIYYYSWSSERFDYNVETKEPASRGTIQSLSLDIHTAILVPRPFLEREFENTVCVLDIISVQITGVVAVSRFGVCCVHQKGNHFNIGSREMADQEGLELGEFILKEALYVRVFTRL